MTQVSSIRRIGVLTSGGDCAGLNAAIRGVVQSAIVRHGWDVFGIYNGSMGLSARPVDAVQLTLVDVLPVMMRQGGTMLGGFSKGEPLQPDGTVYDRTDDIIEGMRQLELDGLIAIGGDGSFSILSKILQKSKIPFVGIPKTIDNDVVKTELAIGFSTAMEVATEALDRLQPTASSHGRVMVLEVMGRDAGHIALESGIAGGADVILIPEIPWNLESVVRKINAVRTTGRNHALVVVSEAIKMTDGRDSKKEIVSGQKRYGGMGDYVASLIAEATGFEARATVLGHVQRGCPPNGMDRLVAQTLATHAVDLLAQGKSDRVVVWNNRTVTDVSVAEATSAYNPVNTSGSIVRAARDLGISLGDE